MIIPSVALLLADFSVALRGDAHPVTQAQAKTMTPAALADALLAPGHLPIVEIGLPDRMAAPMPLPHMQPLDVRLVAAAAFDRRSGFCVKRSWEVNGTPGGTAERVTPEPTLYRLPHAPGECEAPRFMSFFAVAPTDSPRAFTIVRLIADAAAHPQRFGGALSIRANDARPPSYRAVGKMEARSLLAALPLDRIFVVRRYIVTPLLGPDTLTGSDGRPRENWEIYAGDHSVGMVWSIHLALDGDRIAAMRLLHEIPAPF